MIRHSNRDRLMASTVICSAAALAFAAPAHAQTDPGAGQKSTTVQEVVVTGSRIPQPGLTSSSPLTVVTNQEAKLQGVTNAEDLLNTLPQVFASFGTMESNGATGTATVNLRNLGVSRTLVLVDGKRLMPGDTGIIAGSAADLNQIPEALVDRVELVTGGASAVYGSDAVAGVVNFIMKKDFQGLQIDTEYRFAQHDEHDGNLQNLERAAGITPPSGSVTDGAIWEITAVAGANAPDGKGNVTAYATYQHADAVLENKRDFSECALATSTASQSQSCAGSTTSQTGRFQFVDMNPADNVPGGTFGTRIDETVDAAGFRAYNFGSDTFNFAPFNYFQRPDERYTSGYFAHYQAAPWVDVYSSFMFMNDDTLAVIAPGGAFRSSGFPLAGATTPENPTFLVNCDNPLLTGNEQTFLCGGPSTSSVAVNIGRRNVEGGPRITDDRHVSMRFVEGVRGDFGDAWHYDLYGQFGRVDQENINYGYFSTTRLANAFQVVADPRPGANHGRPVCKSVLTGTDPNCVPYDIFAPGGVTAAALGYLTVPGEEISDTTEQIVSGNIVGDLGKYGVKSPWATDGVGVSFGAEYRRETLGTHPDAEVQSGDLNGTGGTTLPVHGAFDVKEAFAELRVPIIQDAPFAKELSFEGGYRASDYSSAGSVSSYKLALDWQIVPDVRLRASFQRAVRAPNINELFTPVQFGLYGGQDPCSGPTPAVSLTNCERSGVLASQYGHISPCSAAQCTEQFGGNTALKPEDSETKSIGIVFTPTFIPGFNATIDYYDIKVTGVISPIPASLSVNQCVATGSPIFCSEVHRSSLDGELSGDGFVSALSQNLGSLQVKGVDLEANYRVNLADWGMGDHGSLTFNLVGTELDHYIIEPVPGFGHYDCAGLFGTTCTALPATGPLPKWRHKLRVSWVTPWNVTLSADWRHIGSVGLDQNTSNPFLAGPHDGPDARIPAFDYLDLAGTWRVRDHIVLRAGVNNVFDKDPPILDSSSVGIAAPPFGNGNTFPQTYDSLGRTIFIGITADF